jgi:cohesin complex subunit SCC1
MAANLQVANREALLLPDRITPYDNLDLPPPPDASWLLSQAEDVTATPLGRKGRVTNRDINLQEDFDNSQFLETTAVEEEGLGNMDDLDLELDFGLDIDGPSQSIEMGLDAPAARPIEDDMFSELGAGPNKEGRGRDESLALDLGDDGVRIADGEGDIAMEDFAFNDGDNTAIPDLHAAPEINRARISESPLSDIDEAFAREVEAEYTSHRPTDLYEPDEDTELTLVRRPAQRAKKQRVLTPDEETTLSTVHIKQQQQDTSNTTRDTSFLPSDPFLLTLMDMHKNGGFVSSIMMEGRGLGWAPELRGMLSLDTIRGTTELKRKRDSGVADVESEQGNPKSPRLELGDDSDPTIDGHGIGNQSVAADGTILEIAGDDGMMGDDASALPAFDETTAPIVHPADSGLVSAGTKHAVHILRDLFGDEAATNEAKRKESAVVFQDLLPERRTTKAEATKMFFECLVLATKDAIKVEQGSGLGDPIRVRGKRGLWGDWAEREAGGEIAHQDEPESAVVSVPAVAVEA